MSRVRSEWSVAEAKAKFSEVVAEALNGRPQRITRYGRDAVVVVSLDAWNTALGMHEAGAAFEHRPGSLMDLFEPIRSLGLDELVEGVPGDLRADGLDE